MIRRLPNLPPHPMGREFDVFRQPSFHAQFGDGFEAVSGPDGVAVALKPGGAAAAQLLAKITGLGTTPGYYKAIQVTSNGTSPSGAVTWDGGEGNLEELRLLAKGCGPAIGKVVRVEHDGDGWYFENDQPFEAIITGNAVFGSRFKYAWSEIEWDGDDTQAVGSGRSGTTSSGYALNRWEEKFTSQYAWGVDMSATDYDSGTWHLVPVGGGGSDTTHRIDTPVLMYETVDANGDLIYRFEAPGGHDGGCPEE